MFICTWLFDCLFPFNYLICLYFTSLSHFYWGLTRKFMWEIFLWITYSRFAETQIEAAPDFCQKRVRASYRRQNRRHQCLHDVWDLSSTYPPEGNDVITELGSHKIKQFIYSIASPAKWKRKLMATVPQE